MLKTKLAVYLRDRNLTAAGVAEVAGLSAGVVYRAMAGRQPNVKSALRLAIALGIQTAKLRSLVEKSRT